MLLLLRRKKIFRLSCLLTRWGLVSLRELVPQLKSGAHVMKENNNSSDVSRVEKNIKALFALTSENHSHKDLKDYSGWGGLRSEIYNPDVFHKLKKILSNDDIESIKKTVKTAYFTPDFLVGFVYKCLKILNFQPKNILEPSAGHGIFFEKMPDSFKNAKITAVEIDQVSCRFLNALYPNILVQRVGFEKFNPNVQFDLIIGNPPFGQIYVHDESNSDITRHSIHHYFVAKAMRLLQQNGVMAVILPRYFLDAHTKHVRKIIAKEGGSLIAAYRLPDNLFENAKVTIDIVFLRKGAGNVRWVDAKPIQEGDKKAFINEYFINHPHNILGKIEFINIYDRHEITCTCVDNIANLLGKALSSFTKDFSNNKKTTFLSDKIADLQDEIKRLIDKKTRLEIIQKSIVETERKLEHLYAESHRLIYIP